jgi:hypothetical protein
LKDEDYKLAERTDRGSLVVSGEYSAGGAKIYLTRNEEELLKIWPSVGRRITAVSEYLDESIPLNLNGCVFREGDVNLYSPSLQLIGIPECTTRSLGYCGNDFCQASALEADCLNQIEKVGTAVGKLLFGLGYLGAFGIDGLWHKGCFYVTEVNPRFQGSSSLGARMASDLDLSDQFLDHIAAFLGLSPGKQPALSELVRQHEGYAQIVCHNVLSAPVLSVPLVRQGMIGGYEIGLLPREDVSIDPMGTIFRVTSRSSVTETGYSLSEPACSLVSTLSYQLCSSHPRVRDSDNDTMLSKV